MKRKVRVDVEKVKGKVNPMIFGQFIEHMGRAIYGGIYEPGNPLSDKDGFRLDVIEKIRELAPPVLRWPGGNFASGYHWTDGVGPKEKRPRKLELAWQTIETNEFGTHEFIELCRRIKAEPYICVNLGWGTPEQAVNWLEYCNADTDTYFANMRRHNGANKPFDVKYWGLGNEIYGSWQHGHCEPEEYAHKAAETAKMMKRMEYMGVSVPIKFVVCGANNFDWDRRVLEYFYKKNYAEIADYISLHRYDSGYTYYGALFGTKHFEQDIVACKGLIEGIGKQYRMEAGQLPKIAFDEWNVWYKTTGARKIAKKYFREGEDLLDELYCLRDALYVGSVLNIFIRHCDVVEMANMAQLVNVIAPIFATPKASYCQPIFYPMKFYRQMHRELAIDVNVISETITLDDNLCKEQLAKYEYNKPAYWRDTDVNPMRHLEFRVGEELSAIDVCATKSRDGKTIVLSLVNRDETQARDVEIDMLDFVPKSAKKVLITGDEPMGYSIVPSGESISDNDYNERACFVTESVTEKIASKFTIELNPHSILLIELIGA